MAKRGVRLDAVHSASAQVVALSAELPPDEGDVAIAVAAANGSRCEVLVTDDTGSHR